MMSLRPTLNRLLFLRFSFNHTAPTEIYTLSLHDALPILQGNVARQVEFLWFAEARPEVQRASVGADLVLFGAGGADRKSTRLNSSHVRISYAVFCLKKKNKTIPRTPPPSAACPYRTLARR